MAITRHPEVQKIVTEFVATHEEKSLDPDYFARLHARLKDGGHPITRNDLEALVREKMTALGERQYQDFKAHIMTEPPRNVDQIFERYKVCYGDDPSRIAWLQRLLREYGYHCADPAGELRKYDTRTLITLFPTSVDQLPIITMDLLDLMNDQVFERYIGLLFKNMKFAVKLTPKSREKGADNILTDAHRKIVVQIKHRAEGYKVNIGGVQEVIGAKKFYGADEAWVVTNRYYSKDARDLARINDVRLIDRDELYALNMQYGEKEGTG